MLFQVSGQIRSVAECGDASPARRCGIESHPIPQRRPPLASLRIQPFDLSFRTAYAQAKELALAQGTVPLATAGSIQAEKRGEGRFVYRYRYDAAGKRSAEYLGPEGEDDTRARVERARAEIRDT